MQTRKQLKAEIAALKAKVLCVDAFARDNNRLSEELNNLEIQYDALIKQYKELQAVCEKATVSAERWRQAAINYERLYKDEKARTANEEV